MGVGVRTAQGETPAVTQCIQVWYDMFCAILV